jgi:thioredoxin-like negative regulator of GroEL
MVSPSVLPLEGWEERIQALDQAVVLFAADWCGYCARFVPVFEQAARKAPPSLPLLHADISDDDTDPRWDMYGIRVVPTVIAFRKGQPVARLDGILGRGIPPAQFDAFLRAQASAA